MKPLRWLGLVAGAVGLYFFARYAADAWQAGATAALGSGSMIAAIVASALLFVPIYPIGGYAWARWLAADGHRLDARDATVVLALSQLGKYVPGYVAQPLGRTALATRYGVPAFESMRVMVYETVLSPAAALLSAGAGLLAAWAAGSDAALPIRTVLAAAGIAAATAAFVLAAPPLVALAQRRLAPPGAQRQPLVPPRSALLKSAALYAAGHLAIAIGFVLVAAALRPIDPPEAALLVAAFALSWLAGFLAPGAPAGLGVREAFLAAMLAAHFPVAFVATAVVAQRIATTLGDLFGAALGLFLLHGHRNPHGPRA